MIRNIRFVVVIIILLFGFIMPYKTKAISLPFGPYDHIQQQIYSLSLDEKIGQMLMVGFMGDSYNAELEAYINQYQVGGLILFERNIKDTAQTVALLNQMKEKNQGQIPLFLSLDEEGGRVSRVPDEFSSLPAARKIGELNQPKLSYRFGQTIAQEIKSLGFNMNYAPVLDVNNNPSNPIIGERAFGTSPKEVITHGVAVMEGMRSSGVIPVVKHFPGHGDTSKDSHLSLPTIHKDLSELHKVELKPFKAAIKADVDAIMIAHLLLPKLDSKKPSSLSKPIITELLRNQLNYNGLVITDDLTMKAVTNQMSVSDAAVQSVKAGNDLLLIAHHKQNVVETFQKLKQAVLSGEISESRINESVYRILKAKEKYNINNQQVEQVDVDSINQKLERFLSELEGVER
ncbi:beta-N-acetylhexosaminidase [Salinibacillus xinjiangensis]|nr:beta-N-acetylhexosaminidase [Salinibacillus xinjiangensis]